jgi:hypothetical protein
MHRVIMLKAAATSGLLLASLLGCPYLCLAHSLVPAAQMVPCCAACTSSASEPGPQDLPINPADGRDDCGACLCRGAVLDAPSRDLDAHAEPSGIIRAMEDSQPSRTVTLDPCRVAHAAQFAALSSGREIRALIASRLL